MKTRYIPYIFMLFRDWLISFTNVHVLRETTAGKNVFSQTSSPALARMGTLPQLASIYTHINIYIYIYIDRERKRERDMKKTCNRRDAKMRR